MNTAAAKVLTPEAMSAVLMKYVEASSGAPCLGSDYNIHEEEGVQFLDRFFIIATHDEDWNDTTSLKLTISKYGFEGHIDVALSAFHWIGNTPEPKLYALPLSQGEEIALSKALEVFNSYNVGTEARQRAADTMSFIFHLVDMLKREPYTVMFLDQ